MESFGEWVYSRRGTFGPPVSFDAPLCPLVEVHLDQGKHGWLLYQVPCLKSGVEAEFLLPSALLGMFWCSEQPGQLCIAVLRNMVPGSPQS